MTYNRLLRAEGMLVVTKKLFTPGPGNIPQDIRVQLSKDIIHHRMGDFHSIFNRVTEKLKKVFETHSKVLILTTSGTGAMESAVVNLFSRGDQVLVINTGFFGARFIEIAKVYGLDVLHLDYPWGETYRMEDVKTMFEQYPGIKGVFLTHHETSTGVVNDVKTLGDYIVETNALFITDCISGMVAHTFKLDEWKVDCALASSQKGFGLPPGLSFVGLSEKALHRLGKSNLPKYYLSYQKHLDYAKKGENPYTPAISLVIALDVALANLLDHGIENIIEKKRNLRIYTEKQFESIGFDLFIRDESLRGNVLVPVLPHKNLNIKLSELVSYLDDRYNIQVSKGQGEYTERMLRVGLISDFTESDINELILRIQEFLSS